MLGWPRARSPVYSDNLRVLACEGSTPNFREPGCWLRLFQDVVLERVFRKHPLGLPRITNLTNHGVIDGVLDEPQERCLHHYSKRVAESCREKEVIIPLTVHSVRRGNEGPSPGLGEFELEVGGSGG